MRRSETPLFRLMFENRWGNIDESPSAPLLRKCESRGILFASSRLPHGLLARAPESALWMHVLVYLYILSLYPPLSAPLLHRPCGALKSLLHVAFDQRKDVVFIHICIHLIYLILTITSCNCRNYVERITWKATRVKFRRTSFVYLFRQHAYVKDVIKISKKFLCLDYYSYLFLCCTDLKIVARLFWFE